MHYIGVRDGKTEKLKKKENKLQFNFMLHDILGQPQGVYKV